MKSNFREWTLDKIDEAFGTKQVRRIPLLDEWMAFEHETNDFQRQYLGQIRDLYLLGGDS